MISKDVLMESSHTNKMSLGFPAKRVKTLPTLIKVDKKNQDITVLKKAESDRSSQENSITPGDKNIDKTLKTERTTIKAEEDTVSHKTKSNCNDRRIDNKSVNSTMKQNVVTPKNNKNSPSLLENTNKKKQDSIPKSSTKEIKSKSIFSKWKVVSDKDKSENKPIDLTNQSNSPIVVDSDDDDDDIPLSVVKKKLAHKSVDKQQPVSMSAVKPQTKIVNSKLNVKPVQNITTLSSLKIKPLMLNMNNMKNPGRVELKKGDPGKVTFQNIKLHNGPMPSQPQLKVMTLNNMKSPIISPLPAKSIVIAIDMEPEKWKKLTPTEQLKIIDEKKLIAKQHLLTLPADQKAIVKPVKVIGTNNIRPQLISNVTGKTIGSQSLSNVGASTAKILSGVTCPLLPNNQLNSTPTAASALLNNKAIAFSKQFPVTNQKVEESQMVGLPPLPAAKPIPMPKMFPNKTFGDVAMIVTFVNTFKKFLRTEDKPDVVVDDIMTALVDSNHGKVSTIANILLQFLWIVLGNEDYKVSGLKIELADLPLTEFTVSYVTQQFIKSQLDKKRKLKRAEYIANAYGEDDDDVDNIFMISDSEDDDDYRMKKKVKKRKKDAFEAGSLDSQLDAISKKLEHNEFFKLNCQEQVLILSHLLNLVLESEDFTKVHETLEAEKLNAFDALASCKKEAAKLRSENEEYYTKQKLGIIDSYFDAKPPVNDVDCGEKSDQKEPSDTFSGMTKRQIDAIMQEKKEEEQKKKDAEKKLLEACQEEERKCITDIKKLTVLHKQCVRLQPLGSDRYCRWYWLFPSGIFGLYVNFSTDVSQFCQPNSSGSWQYFDTIEAVEKLLQTLSSRGNREHMLLSNLKTKYNDICMSIKAINSKKLDGVTSLEEKLSYNDASVGALKADIKETAERIVHGSLGEVEDLTGWTARLDSVQDFHHLKDFILEIQNCIYRKCCSEEMVAMTAEWCKAVSAAKTSSKLHTLFGVLENSILWEKSTEKLACKVCHRKRGRGNPVQLVVCDDCSCAYHLNCLRPALKELPTSRWSCPVCSPQNGSNSGRKRYPARSAEITTKSVYTDDGNSVTDNDDSDDERMSEHEDSCHVCEAPGFMILCDTCPLSYHLDCHNPPLRKAPRGAWSCYECRNPKNRKRKHHLIEKQEDSKSAQMENSINGKERRKSNINNSERSNTSSDNQSMQRKQKNSGLHLNKEYWADDSSILTLGNKRPKYKKDASETVETSRQNRRVDGGRRRTRKSNAHDDERNACRKIIMALKSCEDAGWLTSSVTLETTTNQKENDKPRDLLAVMEKLDGCLYDDVFNTLEDVKYIVENARKYQKSNEGREGIKRLSERFEELVAEHLSEARFLFTTS